ncbi:MAG: leucine-rich repeat domain-containing protein [Oscillospiraceae bacterium]|nr:leucine-rich repeat domain-containing protein [Oscillospiraceae bacterium]
MSIEYSKSGKVLIKCTNDEESVIVPDGVTQIKRRAFKECTNLKRIILPESLKNIGVSAFEKCTSLKKIVLPSGITKICSMTFLNCKALEEVILPKNLHKIGDMAFTACTSLQTVRIPDTVRQIDSYAFSSCDNLHELQYRNLKIRMKFTEWNEYTYLERVIKMLVREDYSMRVIASVKYDLLWQMFFQNPKNTELKDYIRRYFSNIFLNLLDRDDAVSVQKVLDDYDFITKNNIDKFIRYAIDNQKLQCQILLTNYKAEHDLQKPKNLFL